MAKASSQKFIARNRAPRVQIEYDVELYGAEKRCSCRLSWGSWPTSPASLRSRRRPLADRTFTEIDVDNFNDRMKAIKPRVAFSVPNTLTGEGNLPVDIPLKAWRTFPPQLSPGRWMV